MAPLSQELEPPTNPVRFKSQIAWMERNARVGSPKSLLEDFFLYLLQTTKYNDWRAYVEYLTREDQYWSVISQFRREITRLSFTFVPPNALEAHDRVMEFLRVVEKESGPDTTTHTYNSDPGKMNPEGETLKASANIAMEGGGTAEVRAGSRTVYRSRTARIMEDLDSDSLPTPSQPSLVSQVISRLFGGWDEEICHYSVLYNRLCGRDNCCSRLPSKE